MYIYIYKSMYDQNRNHWLPTTKKRGGGQPFDPLAHNYRAERCARGVYDSFRIKYVYNILLLLLELCQNAADIIIYLYIYI